MPAPILITNYDVSVIFLGDNFYKDVSYANSTGSTVTINPGRLIGRILSSAKVLPQVSTGTDGSQYPMAIAAETNVVPDGTTINITVCVAGRVNESKVILGGSDTLDTPVGAEGTGGGIIRDLIQRNTDILLVPSTELSNTDNQ
jgi:hypothetical protein